MSDTLLTNGTPEQNEGALQALVFLNEYLLCIIAAGAENPIEEMDRLHAQLTGIAAKNKLPSPETREMFEAVVVGAADRARERLADGGWSA